MKWGGLDYCFLSFCFCCSEYREKNMNWFWCARVLCCNCEVKSITWCDDDDDDHNLAYHVIDVMSIHYDKAINCYNFLSFNQKTRKEIIRHAICITRTFFFFASQNNIFWTRTRIFFRKLLIIFLFMFRK